MLLIISLSAFQIKKKKWVREIAQWSRAHTVLAESQSLIPSTDIRQLTGDLTHRHTHLCRKESGGLFSPCVLHRDAHTQISNN